MSEPSSNRSESSFVVFSGTSHIELAQGICAELKVPLGKCEIRYFANTEQKPVIEQSVRGKDIFIVQTGSADEHHKEFERRR
jgi:ribose-phosphate pyrophosphokinase